MVKGACLPFMGPPEERKDQTRPDQTRPDRPDLLTPEVVSILRAAFDSELTTLLFSTLASHGVVLAARPVGFFLTFTVSQLSTLVEMDFIPGAFCSLGCKS